MKHPLILCLIGLSLLTAIPSPSVAAQPPAAGPSSRAQADLTWFMVGLRDLGQSNDKRLRLLPAQAKEILPVLEQLAAEKILLTEVPARMDQPNEPSSGPAGGPGTSGPPNAPPGGQPNLTGKQRQEMQRQEKTAERVRQAIDRLSQTLRQEQTEYILSLEFDPTSYGLGDPPSPRSGVGPGQEERPSQAQRQKMMKARQQALERLVKLNREVLASLGKLAARK